jgi:hypothetical protein
VVRRVSDAVFALDGTWEVVVPGPQAQRWTLTEAPLDVRDVSVDGGAAALLDTAGTSLWLPPGKHTVHILGQAEGDALPLAAAGVQTARILGDPEGRTLVGLRQPDGTILGGPATLTWTRPQARRDEGRLLATRWAVGLDVDEGAVRGQARLTLLPVRGDLSHADVALSGFGDDLQITAPPGVRWTRQGDGLSLHLEAPSREPVTLQFSWTSPLIGAVAAVAVPEAEVLHAFRREEALAVGRDASVGVVPELRGGEPTSTAQLPPWAENLSSATPVVARIGETKGLVRALRLAPVQAPPVFVDAAAWDALVTAEGRFVARGTWTVRNDRAAALRVVMPAGATLLLATVDGQGCAVSRDPDGAIRIPLPRSVESVEGLLPFPVVLAIQGMHEDNGLTLPSPEAPVGVRRVTVQIAAGVRAVGPAPGDGVVDVFEDAGALHWDFGGGDLDAAQAEGLYRDAVSAWLDNDTERASQALDVLRRNGVDNANVQGLLGNLAAVSAPSKNAEDAATQRILEQANARALSDQRAQEDALSRAEQALAAGDEEQALEALEEADRAAKKMGTAGGERREANLARTDVLRSAYGKDKASGKFATAFPRGDFKPDETVPLQMDLGSGEAGGTFGGVLGGVLGGVVAADDDDEGYVVDGLTPPVAAPVSAPAPKSEAPSLEHASPTTGAAYDDGAPEATDAPQRLAEATSRANAAPAYAGERPAPAAAAPPPPPPRPTPSSATTRAAPVLDAAEPAPVAQFEPPPDLPLEEELLATIPAGRAFQQSVAVATRAPARGPAERAKSEQEAKEAHEPSPIDRPDVPAVVATRADLHIPDGATVVRFQHTLLREGDLRPLRLQLAPDHGRHGLKESR